MRFRRVLVQIPVGGSGAEGSGADTWLKFWRVPGQQSRYLVRSGGFRCRYLVTFRKLLVLRFRRIPVEIPGEVLEGPADTW